MENEASSATQKDQDAEVPLTKKRKEISSILLSEESVIDQELDQIQNDPRKDSTSGQPVVQNPEEQFQGKKLKTTSNRSISAPEVSSKSNATISTSESRNVPQNAEDGQFLRDMEATIRLDRPDDPGNEEEEESENDEDDDGENDEDDDGENNEEDENGNLQDFVVQDEAEQRAQQVEEAENQNVEGNPQEEQVIRQIYYNELVSYLETFDDKDISPQWNENTLVKWLRAFELFWIPKSMEPNDLFDMLKRNFAIASWDNIDPNYIQELADKKAFYPLINLQMRFTSMGFLMNDSFPRSEEYTDRFFKLMKDICELCEMMFHYVGYIWMKKHNYTGATEARIGMFQWSPKYDQASLNTYQKSLLFCLLQLKKKDYRRCGDMIYAPLYNKKNQFTFAWTPLKTIEDFVYNSADLLSQNSGFLNLTESRNHNPAAIMTFLKKHQCAFFPEIKASRYMISWENGIFNMLDFSYRSYDDIEKKNTTMYKTLASLQEFENSNQLRRQEILKELIARDKLKRKTEADGSLGELFLPENPITAELSDENLTEDQKVEREIAKWNQSAIMPYTNPYTSVCSLKFINQNFEDWTHVKDWKLIPTKYFDAIPNNQSWCPKTKRFFYGFYGRSFFNLGDYGGEKWQACPILLGISDSAKSTVLSPIQEIIPQEFLGLLNSRVEKQFGLQNLLNYGRNLTIIGYEVGQDCQLSVDDLKSIVTGELVKISIKKEQSIDVVVKCPIIFACNALPKMWRNDGFSLEKRCMIFYFNKKIAQSVMKTDYKGYLWHELSKILQKTVLAYRQMVDEFGKKNIWLEAPQEIIDKVKSFLSESDPLKAFINDPTYCESDPTKCVLESTFREQFSYYCESRKFRTPGWKPSYYEPILESRHMRVVSGQREINGKFMHDHWVEGVHLIERPQPQKDNNNNGGNNRQQDSDPTSNNRGPQRQGGNDQQFLNNVGPQKVGPYINF